MDLYWESEGDSSVDYTLKVPVELLSVEDYRSLFVDAGFVNIRDQRLSILLHPENYTGRSFKSRADFEEYRRAGSLMVSGEVGKVSATQERIVPSLADQMPRRRSGICPGVARRGLARRLGLHSLHRRICRRDGGSQSWRT